MSVSNAASVHWLVKPTVLQVRSITADVEPRLIRTTWSRATAPEASAAVTKLPTMVILVPSGETAMARGPTPPVPPLLWCPVSWTAVYDVTTPVVGDSATRPLCLTPPTFVKLPPTSSWPWVTARSLACPFIDEGVQPAATLPSAMFSSIT